MCGIVGYLGNKDCVPIIMKGLERLEYRGYDSAGIAVIDNSGDLEHLKKKGKVSNLNNLIKRSNISGTLGIGHTRWATHGEPNDINAHPHLSNDESIAIIHNGIIENYGVLKEELIHKGHAFKSETDTEVLATFIQDIRDSEKLEIEDAVRVALTRVVGAYAVVVIGTHNPDKMIVARKGSPMVIGLNNNDYLIASDASPLIEHTKEVIYLNDDEMGVISREQGLMIKHLSDVEISPTIHLLDLELEEIEKAGYEHFMLKEIMEQPISVANCMRGRLDAAQGRLVLGGIQKHADDLINTKKIIMIACGTSWHAGLVAEYIFEDLCRIPVEVEYASEFRYRNPIINKGDIVIAISQSGETADTLAAIELAKDKGAIVLGVVNAVGSSIARATHEGAYLHAGPEIGVASTKAFTGQVTVLAMMALKTALLKRTISENRFKELLAELSKVPEKIDEVLLQADKMKSIAQSYKHSTNFLYLGRGYNFPVALEGALKLKEISYIHAEGYPAAEMKHGPIALIDENMPVVFIATRDSSYDKIVSNIQEVISRKGDVIAIVTEGDAIIPKMVNHVVEIPRIVEGWMPLLSVIPLQFLSYYIAILRGANVDQPRNLAKSVTVE